MRRKATISGLILMTIVLILTASVSAEWTVNSSKDPMTGNEKWVAKSSYAVATEEMEFPYHNVEAWIEVVCENGATNVKIGFSNGPNLMNTSLHQDGYEIIDTRIKWDDEIEEIRLNHDYASKYIDFRNDNDIIEKLKNHNTLLLELNWFAEDEVYFEFSLDNSQEAVNEIQEHGQ